MNKPPDGVLEEIAVYLRDHFHTRETAVAGPWEWVEKDVCWVRRLLWCPEGLKHHMVGRNDVGLELRRNGDRWEWDTMLNCDSFAVTPSATDLEDAKARASRCFEGFVWPNDLPVDVW